MAKTRGGRTRVVIVLGQLVLVLFMPALIVVAAAAQHYVLADGELGSWAWAYGLGGAVVALLIGFLLVGARDIPLWLAVLSLVAVPAGVIALEITEWSALAVALVAAILLIIALLFPRVRPWKRLEPPQGPPMPVPPASRLVAPGSPATASAPPTVLAPISPAVPPPGSPPAASAPSARPGPPPAHAFPLFGKRDRTLFAVTAGVCWFFLGVPLLFAPVTLLVAPENVRMALFITYPLALLIFGWPTYLSTRMLIRPPQDALVVDARGIRREGGKLDWTISWTELRGIALSVRTRYAPHSPVRRINRRRAIHLVFAPQDPERFQRRGMLPWQELPGYTAAVAMPDDPVTAGDPALVQGLATALHTTAPRLFAGIYRDGD